MQSGPQHQPKDTRGEEVQLCAPISPLAQSCSKLNLLALLLKPIKRHDYRIEIYKSGWTHIDSVEQLLHKGMFGVEF